MSDGTPFDEDEVIRDGIITVRQLSHHTSRVLDAATKRNMPLAVTKHGKIVAAISSANMREFIDIWVANDEPLRDAMTLADKALANGEVFTFAELRAILESAGQTVPQPLPRPGAPAMVKADVLSAAPDERS